MRTGKAVAYRRIKSNPSRTPLRIKSLSKSLASYFAHISYLKSVKIQAALGCCTLKHESPTDWLNSVTHSAVSKVTFGYFPAMGDAVELSPASGSTKEVRDSSAGKCVFRLRGSE